MIRNFFILFLATCMAGISVSAMEYYYDSAAYDDSDDSDSYYDDAVFRIEDEASPKASNDSFDPLKESVLSKAKDLSTVIQYVIYKPGDEMSYDFDDLQPIDPKKETYFLIGGYFELDSKDYGQDGYQRNFFNSVGPALSLNCNCNIIGVRWFLSVKSPKIDQIVRGAIAVGRRFGKLIYDLAVKKSFEKPISVIAHEYGNVVAMVFSDLVRKPVKYIYALDQRPLPGPYRRFYLRQDSSYLVQTITTGGFKRNYGHRNFYPNGGNYSSSKDVCPYCQSYKLFSDSIRHYGENHQATFCSNYGTYVKKMCKLFPQISYYNKQAPEAFPIGNYYIKEN